MVLLVVSENEGDYGSIVSNHLSAATQVGQQGVL